MSRVVVVGGGLAGLQAAIACADGGARVTVLESRSRLGGAVFSFCRDGLAVDNGQHVFLRCCTAYRSFLTRLGAGHLVTLQKRLSIPVLNEDGQTVWLRRSGLPMPLHLAGALARYRYLSPRERVRVATAATALRHLDLADTRHDRRTFGEWLTEHGQTPRAIEVFWNLITVPTVNLPSSQASLALAAKVFQTGLLSDRDGADVGYARVPLSEVHVEPALRVLRERGAEVQMHCRVDRILRGEPLMVEARGQRFEADAVILATPHDEAARLLPGGAVDAPVAFAGLGVTPIVNLHVVYDRRVTEHAFCAGVDTPVQWVFDRTAGSGLEHGQYLAITLSAADEYARWRVEELRRVFVPALERLFPIARRARVERFFVTREAAATFRQGPMTAERRPGPVTAVPGLYLAGAWTDTGWPATMEGAVRSGLAAARAAMRSVGATHTAEEVAA